MPQAVVFDMDGLLFDTETLYVEAAITAAAELGHEASTELILRTTGGPWPQTRQLLLEHYGEAFPADHFVTVWIRHFRVLAEDRLALKPGVIELLDLLDRLGLPKAIATSSSPPPCKDISRHLTSRVGLTRSLPPATMPPVSRRPTRFSSLPRGLGSIRRNVWRWKIPITASALPQPRG
jgi:beta-phosphoglucomutase-like phosphatase (HAD superfamily)